MLRPLIGADFRVSLFAFTSASFARRNSSITDCTNSFRVNQFLANHPKSIAGTIGFRWLVQ